MKSRWPAAYRSALSLASERAPEGAPPMRDRKRLFNALRASVTSMKRSTNKTGRPPRTSCTTRSGGTSRVTCSAPFTCSLLTGLGRQMSGHTGGSGRAAGDNAAAMEAAVGAGRRVKPRRLPASPRVLAVCGLDVRSEEATTHLSCSHLERPHPLLTKVWALACTAAKMADKHAPDQQRCRTTWRTNVLSPANRFRRTMQNAGTARRAACGLGGWISRLLTRGRNELCLHPDLSQNGYA